MQRSKQQALMFLLGAVLVGGVLGFSANRVMSSSKPKRASAREQMYADIGINAQQQVKMDSVLDETNCKTSDIMRSVRPTMDSIRAEGFKALLDMMTPAQKAAYEVREKVMKQKMDSTRRHNDSVWTAKHPGSERRRQCGGGPRPGGSGSQPGPRGFL